MNVLNSLSRRTRQLPWWCRFACTLLAVVLLGGASMAQPGTTCVYNSGAAIPIADNVTNSGTIIVPAQPPGTVITDMNVYVNVSHTWDADVTITLQSPLGTTVTLIQNQCGSNDNMTVEFDDEPAVPSVLCPPIGVYRLPTQLLSGFDGQAIDGTWTMSVNDNATGDIGAINSWCLIPTTVVLACAPPTIVRTVVPACPGGFNVDLNFTALGNGAPYSVTYDVNGVPQTPITGINATGVVSLTGFANGVDVDIVVVHNSDNACNQTFSNNTFYCPPANDDCANVTPTPLAAGGTATFSGTTSGATDTELLGAPQAWVAVTTTECISSLEVAYCGSVPVRADGFGNIWTACPVTGSPTVGFLSTAFCIDGSIRIFYPQLPAGTYWIGIPEGVFGVGGPYELAVIAGAACPPPPSAGCSDPGSFTSAVPIPIVDNASNSGTIVTGPQPGLAITDMDVYVSVTHTWNSDVTLTLTSPLGTVVALRQAQCGSDDNMDVRFDDEWTPGDICPPVNVYQVPFSPLSAFDGEFLEGTWTLTASDGAGGDQGQVNSWCLIPTTTVLSCTPPSITRTVVPACPGGFNVDLDFTALGNGAPYTINYDVNGVPQTPITGINATGVVSLTGFANGADVDVTVVHGSDTQCNLSFLNNIYSCPPPNDLCENAVTTVLGPASSAAIVGNSAGALANDGVDLAAFPSAWEKIEVTDCVQSLQLDWCASAPGYTLQLNVIFTGCPASIANAIFADVNIDDCGNGNRRQVYNFPAPGTYWVPIWPFGPYTLTATTGPACVPPPANDLCTGVVPQSLGAGETVTYSGSSSGALDTEGLGASNAWEAFTLTECVSGVEIAWCGSVPPRGDAFAALFTACPFGAGPTITNTGFDFGCADGGIRVFYGALQPGTYYIGIPEGIFGVGGPYEIQVTTTPEVEATASVVDNCIGGTFTVVVDVTNVGGGATINYVANPGGPGSLVAAFGPNPLPAFPNGTEVSVTIEGGACDLDLGTYYGGCPIALTCGAPPVPVSRCYRNNEVSSFSYTTDPGETITLLFSSGAIGPLDVITFYDGFDDTGAILPSGNGFSGVSLNGLVITTTTNGLYVTIESDGSGSCQDGQVPGATFNFNVQCTPDCEPADATVTENSVCATYSFTLDVEINSLGAGLPFVPPLTPETEVFVSYSVNGGAYTTPTGPYGVFGTVTLPAVGSFTIGDDVDVKLVHGSDALCDRIYGPFDGDQGCPPPGPGWLCGTPGTYTSSTPIPIVDNATNSGTIIVPAQPPGTVITDMNVFVNVTHTWDGDVTLTLTSPLGTVVTLIQNQCGNVDNMTVEFDDEAAGAACPLINIYRIPTNALSALDGQALAGTWTLSANDNVGGDNGAVNSWCMVPTTTVLSCIPPTVTRTVVAACPTGFNVDLNFTALGDGAPYSVVATVNGTPQAPVIVTTTGVTSLTGFPGGADVDIVINHSGSATCNVTFNNNTFVCPPANDNCANAIAVTSYPYTSAVINTATATDDNNSAIPGYACGTGPTQNVWWTVVGVCGTMTATTCGAANFDTEIGVYTGACGALTALSCNDDACGVQSTVTWTATQGTIYRIAAGGWAAGNFGNLQLTVTANNDTDGDAVGNACDNCAAVSNPGQANADGDATGDACDACPLDALNDQDGDLLCANVDNCPTISNAGQENNDGDSEGDVCDADDDNDGVLDGVDNCPLTANAGQENYDGDAFGDVCDADMDGDGIPNGSDSCPLFPGQNGGTCDSDPGPGYTLGTITACACVSAPCTQSLTIDWQTDANPGQITWEIRNQVGGGIVQSGGPLGTPNATFPTSTCVPNGCYYLRVIDSGGDGMTAGSNGGYILKTAPGGVRLLDNFRNFGNLAGGPPDVSSIPTNQGFCIPLGTTTGAIYTSCDKLDWTAGEYLVCSSVPAIAALYGGPNAATSGYEFWFFNPNGGYSFRKFRAHNVSDGFAPANGERACHIKLNNWAAGSYIPTGVLMNVRVRTRNANVNGNWGPACRMMIDPVRAQCPLTKLMDVPGNEFLSCGATRTWGTGNYVHAVPVTGANKYQFRFRIVGEPTVITRTTTAYFLQLNWTPVPTFTTYYVDVRCSKNGGATWCTDFVPPALTTQWGDFCDLTISAPPVNGGNQNSTTQNAGLSMYPNPNRGDQLYLSLDAVEDGVNTVSVDIYDLFGKRVSARTIAVNDGFINTVLDLDGNMASGMYMVNITAGEKTYTERLVIQK